MATAAKTNQKKRRAAMSLDRILVGSLFFSLVGVGWLYTNYMASYLHAGEGSWWLHSHSSTHSWGAFDFAINFMMWMLMMVAMMLPSMYPTVTLYAGICRDRAKRGGAGVSPGLFVAGYLGAWGLYSVAAVLLQWQLSAHALLDHAFASSSDLVSGAIVICAGIYQFTPLKDACMRLCRWPLGYLLSSWQNGAGGAMRMGFRHGVFCVGCCWALMLIMFVVGMVNMLWFVALTLFFLLEKTALPEKTGSAVVGCLLMLWGTALVALHLFF